MSDIETLFAKVNERFSSVIQQSKLEYGEITLTIAPHHLHDTCFALRDEDEFDFQMLVDVCGVDYLHYGISQWETTTATSSGFERGVQANAFKATDKSEKNRFATIYHLLSIKHNHRIRLKVLLDTSHLSVPSVVSIWPSANWFEREAFDLFGIVFTDHPDLRRILTDYGFIGYPFRKDFPLIGNVEVRYDAKLKKVIYEPVSIELRVLEPKVIRDDNRYKVGD